MYYMLGALYPYSKSEYRYGIPGVRKLFRS